MTITVYSTKVTKNGPKIFIRDDTEKDEGQRKIKSMYGL